MLLTDKYADKIYGTLTCYDRMIVQGYIPGWSHAEGMTSYLKANGIRIFDFPSFSQPFTEQVRQNAQQIADENGIEIEFIRKLRAFRKDDRIQEIISNTGKTEGLIHIFSTMEQCNTYKPWHDKTTGKTFLNFDQSKCLHYYFYFIDKELGLCYLRVPTWAPFRLQFYMNGHNLLASKLQKKNIDFRMHDNAFLEVSDVETAQKLSDRINPEDLHKVLDVFAKRYCPVVENLGLNYTWTIQQIECATDIMFKQPGELEPLYDEIVRTAIYTVKPDNIATFLGQRITYNCKKDYQLFTIMKAANYRYLEFISSFEDHSKGNGNLTKVTSPIMENERSYRGLNFFAERDLRVLEAISRGEYMTFGMQGKDIRQYLGDISSSAMSRIFKRLRLHGIIERVQGTYKYFPTAYGKEVIAAGLAIRNLVLIPALA